MAMAHAATLLVFGGVDRLVAQVEYYHFRLMLIIDQKRYKLTLPILRTKAHLHDPLTLRTLIASTLLLIKAALCILRSVRAFGFIFFVGAALGVDDVGDVDVVF